MIKFNLETPKGAINLTDNEVTVEDITNYAKMLGVPQAKVSEHGITDPSQPKSVEVVEDQPTFTPTKQFTGAKVSTSINHNQTRHLTTPSPIPTVDREGNPYKRIKTSYSCPECGNEDRTEVLEWFKYVKCGSCSTKVFLQPKDPSLEKSDDGFEFTGSAPFFTFEERQAFKKEPEVGRLPLLHVTDDDERSITDPSVDILDVIDKDVRENGRHVLDKYTMLELREFVQRTGLKASTRNRQEMTQAIYEDVKFGI